MRVGDEEADVVPCATEELLKETRQTRTPRFNVKQVVYVWHEVCVGVA